MLWGARRRIREFMRKQITSAQRYDARRSATFVAWMRGLYFFVTWNLVGGMLGYWIFTKEDPETGKRVWLNPQERQERTSFRVAFSDPKAQTSDFRKELDDQRKLELEE